MRHPIPTHSRRRPAPERAPDAPAVARGSTPRRALAAVAAGLAVLLVATLVPTAPAAHAFPARDRQAVIDYLRSVTGTSIVSGQHNKEPATAPGQYTQQVRDITGQYPGLWGG